MSEKPKRGPPPRDRELHDFLKSLDALPAGHYALLGTYPGVNGDVLGCTARLRADGLALGRYLRKARQSTAQFKPEIPHRVQRIAALLAAPDKSHWQGKSNSNIAALLAKHFPDVKADTLRKDVATARKLAFVTR